MGPCHDRARIIAIHQEERNERISFPGDGRPTRQRATEELDDCGVGGRGSDVGDPDVSDHVGSGVGTYWLRVFSGAGDDLADLIHRNLVSKRAEITWSFWPGKNPVIPLAVEL